VQDKVQDALSGVVAPTDPVISATVQIQPGTGKILAMAQSRPFGNDASQGQTNWNYAVDHVYCEQDGCKTGGADGFQAGSTFKIFTLAQALTEGAPYNTIYPGPSKLSLKGMSFDSCDGKWTDTDPTASIKNVNSSPYGEITMLQAIRDSVNTYFVQLERDANLCKIVQLAQSTGMVAAQTAIDGQQDLTGQGSNDLITGWKADYTPSFTLGSINISPLHEAESYATFAANGTHCDAVILSSVKTKDGEDIAVPSANCQQVVDPRVAAGVSYGLVDVGQHGTVASYRIPGYPQAMKTGTTDSVQTEWVAGYTPEVAGVAVVSLDLDPNSPLTRWTTNTQRANATLAGLKGLPSGTTYTGSSGHDAGQVWQPTMIAGLEGKPATAFPNFTPLPDNFTPKYTRTPTATPTPSTEAPIEPAIQPPAPQQTQVIVVPGTAGTPNG
jgi:membrane peptidoglycan carboxypeptidase